VDTTLIRTDIAEKYDGFYEHGCRHGEDIIFFAKIVLNEPFMLLGNKPSARYNRQHSELTSTYGFPLNPVFLNPEILLRYCPAEKQDMACGMVARLALRTAYHKARNGFKTDAIKLLQLRPRTRDFRFAYYQCRFAITFSKILPYWVRFKCFVGPPVRLALKKIVYLLKLKQPPSKM
jgi:hypothetical protein